MEDNSMLEHPGLFLFAGTNLFPGKTPIVLVVVPLDQFAVYHLLATTRTGDILTESCVGATEITKQWQRSFGVRYLLFRRHGFLRLERSGRLFLHTIRSCCAPLAARCVTGEKDV